MSAATDEVSRDRDGDSGQALILALVFVVLSGVWVVSILGLATTDFLGTQAVASQRTTTYSADSAVMGAIERVRDSSTLCSSSSVKDVLTYQTSGPSVVVNCTFDATAQSDLLVTFIATANSGATTLVSANVTFYNGLIPSQWTYGTQPVQITSWADAT